MLRLLRACTARFSAILFALLCMAMHGPLYAQSAPFPDMGEQVAACKARFPDANCQVQSQQYIDKPPSSRNCPGQVCAGGPGRYQEVRIVNPPGSQFEYFIWSYAFVPDDVILRLSGPSFTKALPAGPVLPHVMTATQGRYPFPEAAVGIQMDGGGFVWFSTDQAGEAKFDFVPPRGKGGTFHLLARCWGSCDTVVEKDVVVTACDICQEKGNPIAPGTGEKLQTESLWQDAGEHPLNFSIHYRSFGAPPSGLGPNWGHDYAALNSGSALSRMVQLGNGTKFMFNRRDEQSPWVADTGAHTLMTTISGTVFTRAGDETRWEFDATGVLQGIVQRNGRAMRFGYVGGKLVRVTNAFGRSLGLNYDAAGRMSSITPAGGAAISFGFDASSRLAWVRFPDGTNRAYAYENSGWPNALTGITDESAYRYASFGYDVDGRAILTQHDGGVGGYTVGYGPGRDAAIGIDGVDPAWYRDRVRVTTPSGASVYYDYQGGDGSLRVAGSSMRDSPEDVFSRVTGPGNLPTSETDFAGNVVTYQWDASRKLLVSSTAAAGKPEAQTTSTQWHPTLRLPVLVTEAGKTTASGYDAAGNKLSEAVTDTATGQSRTTRWTYDANGLATTMTDAAGATWQYGYDTAGNRVSVKNPLGQVAAYAYDAAGRLTRQADPSGLISTFSWDARGRLLTQVSGSETTSFTYTPMGQVAAMRQPSGYAVNYGYDTAQRLISATDSRGNRINYVLDAAGNRTREEVRDVAGTLAKATTRIVNTLNQVTHIQGATGQATQLGYDANGQPVQETDPLAQTTRQNLDGLGRGTSITFADGNTAAQAWDALNQLSQVTDPKGVKTVYTNNAFGDVTSESSPDIGTVRYEHDAMGRMLRKTDAKGNVTTWMRDALGRPTRVDHGTGTFAAYAYDSKSGYLSGITDSSGTTTYTRDAFGRITRKVQSVNDNPKNPSSFTTSYAWSDGELASLTYPSGLKLTYKRDATGLVIAVDAQVPGRSKTTAFVTSLGWTALGQPKSWNWAGGDTASRTFDADGRMSANEFATYSYDAGSRITGITQSLYAQGTGTTYLTPLTWSAGYDNRNRLTSFSRAGYENSYAYDANSNRLSAIARAGNITDVNGELGPVDLARNSSQTLNLEDGSNRLLGFNQEVTTSTLTRMVFKSVTPVNYTLDANGSLTSDGLRTFNYDASGRLAKVLLSKDGEAASVSYLHNALGQRVFKSEIQVARTLPNKKTLGNDFVQWLQSQFAWMFASDQASTSIGTAYAYADGALPEWALLGEYDNGSGKGTGRTEYLWLPTPDGAMPIGLYRGGALFAVHADHLGTARLITNESKAAVWQWPYSGFGSNKPTGVLKAEQKFGTTTLKATAPVADVNLRFPGQYFDDETGAFYNWHRVYNPAIAAYWQMDPIGMAGGLNRRSYAGLNTLSLMDPDGKQAVLPGPWAVPVPVPSSGGTGAGNGSYDPRTDSFNSAAPSLVDALRQWMNSDNTNDRAQQAKERKEYSRVCKSATPSTGDVCKDAKENLKRLTLCVQLRQNYSKKWFNDDDAPHAQEIENTKRAIAKLQEFIRNTCTENCE